MKFKITSKIAFFVFIPLVLLLAFIPFFEELFVPIRNFVIAFFVAVFFLFQFKNKHQISLSYIFWLFISLAFLSLFSFIYALNISEALIETSNYLLFSGVFVFFLNIDSEQTNDIIKGFCISAAILAFVVLCNILFNPTLHINNVESFSSLLSPLGHKNITSAAIVLLLPLLLYGFLSFNRFYKYLSIAVFFISIVLVFIMQARSSYLALIGFGLILLWYFIYKRKLFIDLKSIHKWGAISLMVFGLLFVFLNPFHIEFITVSFKRLGSIFSYNENFSDANKTIYERIFLWKGTLNMIKENFFLGVGAGNWKIAFPSEGLMFSRAEQGKIIFQRPHNDFLWIFSELGIAGFIIYLSIFITAIFKAFKKILSVDKVNALLMLASVSGLILFFIISNFSFPKERPFLMFIVIFYLALIVKGNSFKKQEQSRLNLKTILLSIMIIFIVVVNANRINSQFLMYKANQASANQNWKQGILYYQKANTIFYSLTSTSTPVKWYEGVLWSNLENYEEAKKCFEQARKMNPIHLQTLNNLGSTYELIGKRELAKETYYDALAISPLFYDAIINLSSLHYNSKEFDASFFVLSKVKAHQNIMDERYFNNLEITLRAIVIQLSLENKISDKTKTDFLNNMNYLKTSFINSGPNYTNFVKKIIEYQEK